MADDAKTPETGTEEQDTTQTAAQTPEEMRAELERARTALKAANKEAADRRKKLDAFEKAEQARKDADLSELDKARKDLTDRDSALSAAQAELRDERTRNAVELAALALDFHDADDALRPEVLDAIEYDDDGRPVRASIKAALEKLAKSKPHLVAGGGTDKGKEQRSRDGSPPPRNASGVRPNPDRGDDREREYAVQRSTGRYAL